jgi:predicted alpha/beta-fold hydrolase
MKGKPYNVGLEDANLSKLELCHEIKKHLPNFVYLEAPKSGGHCGFYPKNYQGVIWSEKRAAEWFRI